MSHHNLNQLEEIICDLVPVDRRFDAQSKQNKGNINTVLAGLSKEQEELNFKCKQ